MVLPSKPAAARKPVCLLCWLYLSSLTLSPALTLAQGTQDDGDGLLSNGCRWDDRNFVLTCADLGLTQVPYIHPNISGVLQQL